MVSLIIPVYQSTCILGVCVNQYGCCESHQSKLESVVIPVYQPAGIPVIVVSHSHQSYQYTSHTSIPVAVIPTLPLWMSVPYESTSLAAVCEGIVAPGSRNRLGPHPYPPCPCANRAPRTSILRLV